MLWKGTALSMFRTSPERLLNFISLIGHLSCFLKALCTFITTCHTHFIHGKTPISTFVRLSTSPSHCDPSYVINQHQLLNLSAPLHRLPSACAYEPVIALHNSQVLSLRVRVIFTLTQPLNSYHLPRSYSRVYCSLTANTALLLLLFIRPLSFHSITPFLH